MSTEPIVVAPVIDIHGVKKIYKRGTN